MRIDTLSHMYLGLVGALANTLARVPADREWLEHQLWGAQARVEACIARLYRLRERCRYAPDYYCYASSTIWRRN